LSRIDKRGVIIPATFLFSIAGGTAGLALIFYLNDVYHATAETIGLFSALNLMSYSAGCFLLRPLGRKLLPRHSMVLATAGAILGIILLVSVRSIGWAFLFYALYGFSTALYWPPIMGWLTAGIEGKALNKATSRYSMAWSLGGVLSPYLAGVVSEINPIYPLYLSFALFAGLVIFIVVATLALPRVRLDLHRTGKKAEIRAAEDHSTPMRFISWIGLFSSYLTLGVLYNIFPIFATHDGGMSQSGVGLALLIRALATTTGFLVLGRMAFWQFNAKVAILLQVMIAAVVPLVAFAGSFPALAAAMVAIGFLNSLAYMSATFHAASGAIDREKRMGIGEVVLTTAQVIGAVAGGIIYNRLSMGAVFAFCSGATILGLAGQVVFLAKTRIPAQSR
jgi:predicted MFS family arabinose efflux permease